MQKKKAQTTLFILIGVVILFSVVAIVFFRSGQVKIEKIPQITEETPTEMQPLRAFVQECISKTGLEAVKLIGAHGGYISLDP
ncbi:MAG: hypothetical protein NT001_00005, partial [Candidatus Woesearchaeota archaeon]|nr:hypothetical protein [Candidatus Woesearchaeota archaeon]